MLEYNANMETSFIMIKMVYHLFMKENQFEIEFVVFSLMASFR